MKVFHGLPESTAVCRHCNQGIYNSALGWMHSNSSNGLCAAAPHLKAEPVMDDHCDICGGDSPSVYCAVIDQLDQEAKQS